MRGAVWTRGLKVVLAERQNLPERYTIAFAAAVFAVLLRESHSRFAIWFRAGFQRALLVTLTLLDIMNHNE
jgi:hypothetical protein